MVFLSSRLWVFILNIIIYRCAAGFEEYVPAVANCATVDGKSADEGSAKAGEKRLCVYLFLIFAYTLIFWAMKRKNEI